PDDDAVSGSLLLDLYPRTLARKVATVVALGDHAFDSGHELQPVFGFLDDRCLAHELQAGDSGLEQPLEAGAAIAQMHVGQIGARLPQDVENQQDSRLAQGCPRRVPFSYAETFLQRAEVRAPVGIGDNNLTIHKGARWQGVP